METAVISKIKKLLELGKSPNENEAATAMLKAQKLLLKHNLDLATVKSATKQTGDEIIEDSLSILRAGIARWESYLINGIVSTMNCRYFLRMKFDAVGRRRSDIVIVGHTTDIKVATYFYEYLIDACNDLAKAHLKGKQFAKQSQRKLYRESYLYGVTCNVIERLKKQYNDTIEASHELNALIKSKATKVNAFMDANYDLETGKKRKFRYNATALENGMADGKKIALNRAINSDGKHTTVRALAG